jgi:hypothetical protein
VDALLLAMPDEGALGALGCRTSPREPSLTAGVAAGVEAAGVVAGVEVLWVEAGACCAQALGRAAASASPMAAALIH